MADGLPMFAGNSSALSPFPDGFQADAGEACGGFCTSELFYDKVNAGHEQTVWEKTSHRKRSGLSQVSFIQVGTA